MLPNTSGPSAACAGVSRALFGTKDGFTGAQLCPLCFKPPIDQCVLLHPRDQSDIECPCFVCGKCAVHWRNVRGGNEAPMLLSCPMCFAPMSSHNSTDECLDGEAALNKLGTSRTGTSLVLLPSAGSETCGACEGKGATSFCVPCGFPLCAACVVSSHQRGRYITHKVVPLTSATRAASTNCNHHPSQPLNAYCTSCCTSICINCYLEGAHRGHSVESVESAARKARSDVGQMVEKLQSAVVATKDLSIDVERQILPMCKEGVMVRQGAVKKCFSALRAALDERERQLMSRISGDAESLVEKLSSLITRCTTAGVAFQNSVDSVRNALKLMDDGDMAKFGESMKRGVGVIQEASNHATGCYRCDAQKYKDTILSCDSTESVVPVTQLEELMELIRNLGSSCVPFSRAPPTPVAVAPPSATVDHLNVKTPELTLSDRAAGRSGCAAVKESALLPFPPLEHSAQVAGDAPSMGFSRLSEPDWGRPTEVSRRETQWPGRGTTAACGPRFLEWPKLELTKWGPMDEVAQGASSAVTEAKSVGGVVADGQLTAGCKRGR